MRLTCSEGFLDPQDWEGPLYVMFTDPIIYVCISPGKSTVANSPESGTTTQIFVLHHAMFSPVFSECYFLSLRDHKLMSLVLCGVPILCFMLILLLFIQSHRD